ncbi:MULTISPECIES: ATP-binding protein [unclassified Leucobacter]|nr:ATP-binding protein [Leucobacter sp. Ag1]
MEASASRVTCVIGPNGSGKSQLLRAIVDAAEGRNKENDSVIDIVPSMHKFSQVLAISNLVTDVFPSTRRLDKYRYLGVRQATNWTGTKAVESLTIDSVLLSLRDVSRIQALHDALKVIGFSEFALELEAEKKPPRGRPRMVQETKLGPRPLDLFEAAVLPLLREMRAEPSKLDLDAWHYFMGEIESSAQKCEVDMADGIAHLRKRGELVANLVFTQGTRHDSVSGLSAGQLLVISLAARLAAHIAPDSLVLIDEPEIGLHPTWQSAVAPLLRALVPKDLESHIVIATHSPHVVVDADDVLSSGEQWGRFEPFEEAVGGRSVENILYRVFGARVVGNTEVEEDLTLLASFIAEPSEARVSEVRLAQKRLQGVANEETPLVQDILREVEMELERTR